MINFIADMHMHTLASTHAYNTVTEMVHEAKRLGLFAIAITDHAPLMPDAPHPWHFHNLRTLPHKIEDVYVLRGIEANVCNVQGKLDYTIEELRTLRLDWVIASIHRDTLEQPLDFNTATQLWVNVAQNPCVDMIGHSESRFYAYDYDYVAKVFAQHNKVVEINANSAVVRPGNEKNMRALALACKKNGVKIAVNSDAHSLYTIAHFETVVPMLEEIDFPAELIINASRENLIAVLKAHEHAIAQEMEEGL